MEIVIALLGLTVIILGYLLYNSRSEIDTLNKELIITQNRLFEIEHIVEQHNEIETFWKSATEEYERRFTRIKNTTPKKSFIRPNQYCDCPFVKNLPNGQL